MEENNRLELKHIIVLAVLCLNLAAAVGLVTNIGGLFMSPIAAELNTGRGNVSNTMSICNIVAAVGGMILPRIIKKTNFKGIVTGASSIIVICTYLLSLSNALWQMYILNAIRGFMTGFSSTVLSNMVINNWFYNKTATFSSIVMCFSGAAGAVFSPIFGNLIDTYGWRTSYQIAALLMFVLFIPFVFAPINITPDSVGLKPYGSKTTADDSMENADKKVPLVILAVLTVYASLTGLANSVIQHFPSLALSNGLTVGSIMLSMSMVSNTGSKLIMGLLIDKFGVTKSIVGTSLFVTMGFIMILFTSNITYVVGAFIVGFGYSLSIVGVSMLVRNIVGQKRFSLFYPTIAMFSTMFYAFGTSLVGYAYDIFNSYVPVLIVIICAEFVIMTCAVVSSKLKEKYM